MNKQLESRAMVDMKLDVVVHPVSDVDRAKLFYLNMDGGLEADFPGGDNRQRSKDHQRVKRVVAIFAASHSIESKNTASL